MNPEQIRALIQALLQERSALMARAQGESRDFTDEENTQYEALTAKITTQKQNLERTLAHDADMQNFGPPTRDPVRPAVDADPPAAALPHAGFETFGHMLRAVALADMAPHRGIDPRLLSIRAAASGANEGVPSDGGFLVGTDDTNELMTAVAETGILVSRVRHTGIGANSNGLKINVVDETSRVNGSRWGGVQAYWEGEADVFMASRPKFAQIELALHKLTGLFYATDELLQDAAALESVAMEAFTEEFGFKLDDAIIRGNGAGQPLGILNAACTITVSKESTQGSATLLYENIVKMWTRMPIRNRANAVWLINQDIEPQLYTMSLAIGTGGAPVYLPPGGASGSPYSTLMSRPVLPIEQASTLGTVGDIMLVDLNQYRMIDKGGINQASSIHVRFVYDEMTFRWVLRTDGQPMWRSAVTPANGSSTVSPFIILETR